MSGDPNMPGPSHQRFTGAIHLIEEEETAPEVIHIEQQFAPNHLGYYEVEGERIDEPGTDGSSVSDDDDDDDEYEDEEIHTTRLRKPMLALSNREKNDICRYKNMKPETSLRQMSEHFSQLWNKIVCRRSVYDTLMQNEKWNCIENRAYQDTEFTSNNALDDIENLLFDWITEILKAEARVWDEDVRNAAAIIRDIRSLKGFMPTPAWLNDFKFRHKFETDPNDGSIVSNELDKFEEDPAEKEKRQIRIDIGDGLSYQIDINVKTTFDAQREKIPPLSQFAAAPYVRRGGPHVPPNRMSEILFSDSDDEDDDQVDVGLQPAPQDDGLEALLGSACSSSFHDVLKHLVYGSNVMSEKAQEMMAAATEVALDAELFGEGSDEATVKRSEKRARLIADLVDKVLEAKRRRDEAEVEMYQEKKLRDINAFKVAEEQRKRHIERRELHLIQKRILETEERFYSDQQRNELIRKELLLVEDPIATMESDSGKKAKVLQPSGIPVRRQKVGLATVVGGAE